MMTKRTKMVPKCKTCKGSGRVNCILGSLRCGHCNGTGKRSDLGFVKNVQRAIVAKKGKKS